MSGLSISAYFPWRKMKVVYHNHSVESHRALVRLEPDRRFHRLCHACGPWETVRVRVEDNEPLRFPEDRARARVLTSLASFHRI